MVDSFFNALPDYLELLMGYVPMFMTIAVPLAVFIAYRKTQNETDKAKKTADRLGLSYINVFEKTKNSQKKNSFLLGFLSGWSTWAMQGTFNSIPVQVELIVKGKQQRYIPRSDLASVSNPTTTSYSRGTSYVASFQNPLPFDIIIRQNINMSSSFSQAHPTDKIEINDERLNQMLFVSGKDKNKIQEWLNSNQRKDALKKLYQTLPSVNLNSNGLCLYDLHNKADYSHLQNNLSLLSEAILKLKID